MCKVLGGMGRRGSVDPATLRPGQVPVPPLTEVRARQDGGGRDEGQGSRQHFHSYPQVLIYPIQS